MPQNKRHPPNKFIKAPPGDSTQYSPQIRPVKAADLNTGGGSYKPDFGSSVDRRRTEVPNENKFMASPVLNKNPLEGGKHRQTTLINVTNNSLKNQPTSYPTNNANSRLQNSLPSGLNDDPFGSLLYGGGND